MYMNLAGFASRLTGNITDKTRHLPLPNEDYMWLLSQLDDGDHSYLEIRDGNTIEVVQVTNTCDALVIDRGVEQTRPMSFRCGTGVLFTLTMQGVKDMICQMTDEDCKGAA